jgi:hypothetical protein
MKKIITLNESQLINLVKKIIKENDLSEISSDLFKSAINVSKERGTDRRTYKLGQTYFNQFIGKPLMDGKIINIGVNKPQQGNYSDVSIEIEKKIYQNDGYHKGKDMIVKDYISYDIDSDIFNLDNAEVSRRDAAVLSKIAQHINPDTKYKETGKYFNIKGFR